MDPHQETIFTIVFVRHKERLKFGFPLRTKLEVSSGENRHQGRREMWYVVLGPQSDTAHQGPPTPNTGEAAHQGPLLHPKPHFIEVNLYSVSTNHKETCFGG